MNDLEDDLCFPILSYFLYASFPINMKLCIMYWEYVQYL